MKNKNEDHDENGVDADLEQSHEQRRASVLESAKYTHRCKHRECRRTRDCHDAQVGNCVRRRIRRCTERIDEWRSCNEKSDTRDDANEQRESEPIYPGADGCGPIASSDVARD